MAQAFLSLDALDQNEALEVAAAATGRSAHLLEKDVWVVWALQTLFTSAAGASLTFKGGTSLSKAYQIIDRFSEDIDLTYDIRQILPDLVGSEHSLPSSKSQARKWTDAVRQRLPDWIQTQIAPVLQLALEQQGLSAQMSLGGHAKDSLYIDYAPQRRGSGYVSPRVLLEFGARATGEPHELRSVVCDMQGHIAGIEFPQATARVMRVERTFWEKATAAHVYCAQGRIRGERFARHWHDLAMLADTPYFDNAIAEHSLAQAVAQHKSWFFAEKAADGTEIDYQHAVQGGLQIVPQGPARAALQADYGKMIEDGVLLNQTMDFSGLMRCCEIMQAKVNQKMLQNHA
jgi:Nucleotidyl transferase AbiEii toxin, Type IV TA system